MTTISLALLAVALLFAVWSYLLYPVWIRRRAARQPDRPEPAGAFPAVEVLLAAADEEAAIGDRVRDLLAQEYPADYRITIGCDGCTDATAARAREASSGRGTVRVVEFPVRRGKAGVLDDLAGEARAEVLVFTDANTRFEPGAVLALAGAMRDPRTGAACGMLELEVPGGATPETLFWRRESLLKQDEGRLGVCLGANGAIYAARRSLVAPLPAGTALDDFLIPVRIARDGYDVVFVRDALAREHAPDDVRREAARRFRIGVGAGQVLVEERWLWRSRRPLLTAVFLSRKAARWLAPVLVLLAATAGLASPSLDTAAAAILGVAALLAASVLARPRLRGFAARLYYFAVMNLALSAGVLAGVAGYRLPVWKRPLKD